MRAWLLAVVLASACGTDEGAHLTLALPAGVAPASRLQIVLASADPAMIETVDAQRVAPKQPGDESVVYYRQRATGGVIAGPIGDGFELQITPNPERYPDEQYIPFVLLEDDAGALVGIATLRMGDDPTPQPIAIRDGEVTKYTLAVEGVTTADGSGEVAPGRDLVVACDVQTAAFPSGIVWRPQQAREIRILLGVASGDATQRPLDLDCDAALARTDDCDDIRAQYHAGAPEACDGEDTNCDGATAWAVPCGGASCPDETTGKGIALCDDTTGTTGTCQSDPICACTSGTAGCTKCTLELEAATQTGTVTPCQPAVGKLATGCDAGSCKVVVLGASDGWKVEVSAVPTGSFGSEAKQVGHDVYVRAKLEQGDSVPGQRGAFIGEVLLGIYAPGGTRLLPVALQANADLASVCTMVNGDGVMICQ